MTTHPNDPSTTTDCSLLAKVPLPPGAESAGPWRTDQAGHLLRDLSAGRVQHGDGEARAACRLCADAMAVK